MVNKSSKINKDFSVEKLSEAFKILGIALDAAAKAITEAFASIPPAEFKKLMKEIERNKSNSIS